MYQEWTERSLVSWQQNTLIALAEGRNVIEGEFGTSSRCWRNV